jgi:glycosyltransferase involved in cell wall biosynthesis
LDAVELSCRVSKEKLCSVTRKDPAFCWVNSGENPRAAKRGSVDPIATKELVLDEKNAMNVAMLLSCGSFEGFFGWIQGQSRQSYLESYRNDWAWYYARGLLENGINPTLYIPALFETGKYETDVGISVRFLPLSRWYRPFEQVWLKRLSRRTRWSLYAEERMNTMAFMRSLREALTQDDVDLLYIQEYWSGRFDHIVGGVSLPVVGADHGGVSDRVVKLFKPRAFKKAVLCYGQTENECRIIEQYGGRSVLAPNGCDVSEFFPHPAGPRSKTVLTVTRLTNRQKRTSDLIQAMAELPEEWSLDVVGTGPDKPVLETLVADLNLSSRVRFHGFVGRAEVREFLRRCGVYAMPSANEAVALAVLEAMACGAAVVLSQIRAFEQLVTDGINGRLVPVGDVKGLAAGIIDAWEHRESLGRAASDTIRTRFDTRVLYSQLAESLRGAIHQNGAYE